MSGAVYQPTTVTYESNSPQERWQDRPISYLASTVNETVRRPCSLNCLPARSLVPVILIVSGVATFSLGLVMLIHGAVGYSDTSEEKEDMYLIVTIFGAIFFALSILLFVFFLRLTRRMCWRNVKDHMIAAQYAPVSEVAYQPNIEDHEQSKLMSTDNKIDLTNEDTDRMVESDPRIVLRPLNAPTHEET